MPSTSIAGAPGLQSFLLSLKAHPVDYSIEHFISLLKRRQIKHSRPCAVATAHLLLRVVSSARVSDVEQLIERIKHVGRRLCAAQPRELVIGNIVRRVLGLVHEEVEADRDRRQDIASPPTGGSNTGAGLPASNVSAAALAAAAADATRRPGLLSSISTFNPLSHGGTQPIDIAASVTEAAAAAENASSRAPAATAQRPPMLTSHTYYAAANSAPMVTSLFDLFSFADAGPPATADENDSAQSPPAAGPNAHSAGNSTSRHGGAKRQHGANAAAAFRDLKPDIIGGIEEIIDELGQVDDQIAAYALEHIHANEMILTHSSSLTVQKFFLKAAAKRKFTVVHAESAPNDAVGATSSGSSGSSKAAEHDANAHDDILSNDAFRRPLMAAGLTVIVISDAAAFALMSRVNKVILDTHAVLANGGLVAAAGARMIAGAARAHRTPVVVVSGVYKLSPVYPFDVESLIEHGGAGAVVDWRDGELVERVDVLNPLYDYVPAELVDLYITNLGGHAPSYLYRIVSDHYRAEDINLHQ